MKQTTIDGVTHEWGETVEREKDLPFKLHVPETSTLTIGVTSNQEDPDPDDFVHPGPKSKTPTTAVPSQSPSVSTPTEGPSYSDPTEQPSYTQPSREPSATNPSLSPSFTDPSLSPAKGVPTSFPSFTHPTGSPSFTDPSLSPSSTVPSLSPSYTDPSLSPSFTSPSLSPSFTTPSSIPTLYPSFTDPSAIPTLSPIAGARVLATIIAAIAEETRQLGTNPKVDITYTTVIKKPWTLTNPVAQGNAIAGDPTYAQVAAGSCDTFTEIPSFLQSDLFYCQTWHLQFPGDRRCTTEARTVSVAYSATSDRGNEADVDFSWEFDLGFSSAFDCSEDLGSFQIAIIIEGSSGGNDNFDNPGDAFR